MSPPERRRRPTAEQLIALRAIDADDQGQRGDLDVFTARACEGLGWTEKVGGEYRLTPAGRQVLAEHG